MPGLAKQVVVRGWRFGQAKRWALAILFSSPGPSLSSSSISSLFEDVGPEESGEEDHDWHHSKDDVDADVELWEATVTAAP